MKSAHISTFLLAGCVIATFATNVFALDCPAPPVQANKDWDTQIQAEVGKIGPVKGAQLETRVRTATVDLLGRLPAADRVYLEQMMFSAYCSALRDDISLSDSEKSLHIRAYNTEVRNTLRAVTTKGASDNSAKEAALLQLKRIPLPYTPDAFAESAAKGDLANVRLFLAAGMDPDAKDGSDRSAIAQAAAKGHLNIVQALLKSGANKTDAIRTAAMNDHSEIVIYLLDRGASKDEIDNAFLSAARAGSLKTLQALVKFGADRSRANEALLLAARGMPDLSQEQRGRVISFLLALGADVNTKNEKGWNALHYASNDALAMNVQALLDAGADANMICNCNYSFSYNSENLLTGSERLTPLILAAVSEGSFVDRANKQRVVELLLKRGASPDPTTTNGTTTLMFAAYPSEDAGIVQALLNHGANVNSRNNSGNTALMFAIRYNPSHPNMDVVKELIAKGTNVNATNLEGEAAIMYSVFSADILGELIKSGADVNLHEKVKGSTALMWAAGDDKVASVEVLLGAGADIHAKNKFGRSALMLAVRENHPDTVRVLLKHGAKADDQDEDGKSVLNYAEENLKGQDSIDMVRILKKAGAK